jgi:hypothetical protein
MGAMLTGMGLTAHVVVASFVVFIVAGVPAFLSANPRKVPRYPHPTDHVGRSGPKHKAD